MLPGVVLHADWGTNPSKRIMAVARLHSDGRYAVDAPRRVGQTGSHRERLGVPTDAPATVLVGFDFPIGVPVAYAERAGISDFRHALTQFGTGRWRDFYNVCSSRSEIDIHRPFFPHSCKEKGCCRRKDLEGALGMTWHELLRMCERRTNDRRAACPLFWTLGGNQVGKASISGWREFVQPMISEGDHVGLWPFDGTLGELLQSRSCVIVETYPAEFYGHLGLKFTGGKGHGKRSQLARRQHAARLLAEASGLQAMLSEDARAAVRNGFEPQGGGDDAFDAMVGLLGMLKHLRTGLHTDAPAGHAVTTEGWILGQKPIVGETAAPLSLNRRAPSGRLEAAQSGSH